jgi:radical SAM PhpK family P-methyltransferase
VDIGGQPTDYVSLLNHLLALGPQDGTDSLRGPFKSGEIPNLAALYLSNYLRKSGITTQYINLFQDEKQELLKLLKENPLCVAITTTFYVLNHPVTEIVKFIREHNPHTKIVVGGPLVGNHFRNLQNTELSAALCDLGADFYVVDPQGEATLAQLVRALKTDSPIDAVPNLAYADPKGLIRTAVVPEANSMDEVDIDWRKFAEDRYLGPTIQMRTARSCAFKCSFCNYPTRAGKLSLASLDTIRRELSSIHSIGDVKNVVFIDDTFNVPLPRFKDICRMIIEKKFDFNWFSYFRCSNSDEEAIDLMARSGCKGVFLGIESGSPSILKNMNKAATIERYAEGIRLLRERGILTFGSFIIGFPGETVDTVKETSEFIREHAPDFYRAQMWYCEAGTPIVQQRDLYRIEGEGFVWQHATMSSQEAMAHIERMFLTIDESIWLPQWSFDFWFIPYILGKGVTLGEFKRFMSNANKLLAMEIAYVAPAEKRFLQEACLKEMRAQVKPWKIDSRRDVGYPDPVVS